MDSEKNRYEIFEFADGTRLKVEEGLNEITGESITNEDIMNLRRTRKTIEKLDAKQHRFETTSIEHEFFNSERNSEFTDSSSNIEIDYVQKEEFSELYDAINKLSPSQKSLIRALYSNDRMSAREYAKKIGVSHVAVNKQHKATLKKLRELLSR